MRNLCLTIMGWLAVTVMAQPTAREWNESVTAGWNLGNQLECPPSGQDNGSVAIGNPANALSAETAWGNPRVTQQTMQAVRDAGFNAVRIPVRWQHHISDATTMTIDEEWLQRVKQIVGYALDLGMKVIINTHHEQWLESRPTYTYNDENNRCLRLLWTQIATAFKDYGYELAFAGTNEVHVPNNWNAPTAENQTVQNAYNQTFVDAVRATGGQNLQRHLIVQTYNTNIGYGLSGFVVPTDIDGNDNRYMSVEVHYYTPWEYCGTNTYYYWGQQYKQYGPISSYDEQAMTAEFQQMAQAWGQQGLGIVIGEWGITDHYTTAGRKAIIHENMSYFCKTLVSEARQRGFSTFVWDNNAFGNGDDKFGIFDRWNQMTLTADWIVRGIMDGVATGIAPLAATRQNNHSACLMMDKGRVVVVSGDRRYSLTGVELKD